MSTSQKASLTRTQLRDMASHLHGQSHIATNERVGPLVIARGEGVHLWDESGRQYLDAMAGVGNATLGYSEPRLIEAAAQQLARLPFHHTFGNRTNAQTAELAERLVGLAPVPMSKAFFAGSGSEANDSAILLAWNHWRALGHPARRKIVSYRNAYHGSTIATLSLSGFDVLQQSFGLPLPEFLHVPGPHHYRDAHDGESEAAFSARLIAELEELLLREGTDTVAAFFLEPVMGLGGIVVPPAGYIEGLQAMLRRHGILLVADEVVCGYGRTGSFWGSTQVGLSPDVVVCSKGLTAGYMPMSAVLLSERICDVLRNGGGAFGHGFTQGGNPVAAAVALEVLNLYEERGLVARAQRAGERLGAGLRALAAHPRVGQVRGSGMMWGIELMADKARREPFDPAWALGHQAVLFAQSQGVILRMAGDCLVTLPPLIVEDAEIDRIVATLAASIDFVSNLADDLRRSKPRGRTARR